MWKIVIVDDDVIVRRGIVRSIDWAAHQLAVVGEASNGQNGLDVVCQLRPDIAITDIRMPVRDGLWLCEQIAQAQLDTQLIILSGYEDFDYARRAMRHGVREYLVKPVMADDLVRAVERAVAAIPHGRGEPEPPAAEAPHQLSSISTEDAGALVKRALAYVERNYMTPIDLSQVVAELFVSENYFSKVFKAETGKNFTDYLNRIRIDRARELLSQLDLRISDVAEMVGYQSYKYFHYNFSKYMGCSPYQYRNRYTQGDAK